MDSILKFLGLDRRKDEPQTHADLTKRMDEFLEKNVPKYEPKVSLKQKAWDLAWISSFIVLTIYFYKVDIKKFHTKRERRKYKWFTAVILSTFGILLVSRWKDDGIYRPVEIEQQPGESNLDVRKRYLKEKLFHPEAKEFYDKYSKFLKGDKSEESSSTDSKTSSDSEKPS